MKLSRLLFLPALLLFISACDTNVMDDDVEAMVSLRVQPVFNGQPLLMGQTYDHNGTAVSFSAARIYVSDIVLVGADGTETAFEADPQTVPAKDQDGTDITHTVTDRVILAKHDLSVDEWDLGMVPVGEYAALKFRLGIVGMDNRVDPTQMPADHPMAKQTDLNNHWSWANGYIYMRLDGLADSDGDGTPDEVWETHLGKDSFSKEVNLQSGFSIGSSEPTQLHVMVDYHQILSQIDLGDPLQRLCHTGDNLPVANAAAGQLSGSFMLHGVHEGEVHGQDS